MSTDELVKRLLDCNFYNEVTMDGVPTVARKAAAEITRLSEALAKAEAERDLAQSVTECYSDEQAKVRDELKEAHAKLAASEAARERLVEIERYIPDLVKNAMLTMWREICADTGCHPLDIEHGIGKYLTFEPRHWAQQAGLMVQANIRAALASAPEPAQPARDAVLERLQELITAIDNGAVEMSSPDIGGHDDIPQHPWHEEWLHHARRAISTLPEQR